MIVEFIDAHSALVPVLFCRRVNILKGSDVVMLIVKTKQAKPI